MAELELDLRSKPDARWIAELRRRYPVERTVDRTLTRKLERRATSAHERVDLADVTARLERFLGRRIKGEFAVRNLRTLTGGASKEQFVFELDWLCDGERRTGERMVLRRETAEAIVETNRLREHQIVSAVSGVVPVPRAYWLDETGEELARPAMIYGFVDGVQKPSKGTSKITGVGINFDPEYRAALGPQFIDMLARIHNFDHTRADVSAFEIPRVGTTEDIDWQLNWWTRVWHEDTLEDIPLMTVAEQWLRANRKPLDHVSLVHADYRTGNYLFNEDTKKVTAMLDWELAYFGDRHYDLAWALMPVFTTLDENGKPLYSSLFPDRDKFLRDYEKASGLSVDQKRLDYYNICAYWKSVVMCLASGPRAANGLKTHQDVLLSYFAAISYTLLESLRREMERVG